VNISGGTFNSGGNSWGSFRIADYGTGTGTLNLSGTGVVNAAQYTAVGGWGNGTLNIDGGTWNQATGGIVVGDAGDLNWTGSGLVNQSGGTVNADWVFLQKGTYNLDGGVLSTFGVADTKLETQGVLNLNGGWLMATGANADFITADTVEIKSGGVVMHTREHDITVNKGMVGAGGLNKGGSGILRLVGTNSYGGYTTVVEGKLVVSGAIVSTNNNAYVIVETGNPDNPDAPEIEVVDGATLQCVGPLGLGWQANTSGKLTQSGGLVHVTRDNLVLADNAGSTGTLEVTGGSTMVASNSFVGRVGTGTLTLGGGAFQGSGTLSLGLMAGASGSVNITGGTHSVARTCFVGEAGSGTLEISGGVLNAGTDELGSFRIADYGSGPGTGIVNLSATGEVNAPNYTAVGGAGNGTLNITGGTWNQAAGGIVVGDAADLNWTGSGEVNQSGGTVNADYVFLQKGTYNLNGGVLAAFGVADTKAEKIGVFNFNGGTLRARDNNADFITADTVEIKSGNAIIDTQTNNATISTDISGAGGLTKKGAGVLTLAGVNAYGGSTTVEAGTLRFVTANFTAEVTGASLTVTFNAPPTDGSMPILPGTLNGSPTVTFSGLAAGQSGELDLLSGEATFTTTSTGLSFSSWSGGQTLTPELLGKYAIGGASGPSASSVRPVLTSTGGGVTLSALVRTNSDASSFAVVGEYSTNLASWSPLTNNPAGTPSANTNGVPEGFQRKDFTVPSGAPKMFLRLKSSL
jgi:autotransporter-associated beta strand protein/T5SS/PEP-CTERM-associated repeat protein